MARGSVVETAGRGVHTVRIPCMSACCGHHARMHTCMLSARLSVSNESMALC